MRYWLLLLLVPALGGCAMDDEFEAPPPPAMYGAPNACSGSARPTSPMYAMPQTQEPPR